MWIRLGLKHIMIERKGPLGMDQAAAKAAWPDEASRDGQWEPAPRRVD